MVFLFRNVLQKRNAFTRAANELISWRRKLNKSFWHSFGNRVSNTDIQDNGYPGYLEISVRRIFQQVSVYPLTDTRSQFFRQIELKSSIEWHFSDVFLGKINLICTSSTGNQKATDLIYVGIQNIFLWERIFVKSTL